MTDSDTSGEAISADASFETFGLVFSMRLGAAFAKYDRGFDPGVTGARLEIFPDRFGNCASESGAGME
jgi:hypothetical protein